MPYCKFCNREFVKDKARSTHQFQCKENPDRLNLATHMHTQAAVAKMVAKRMGVPLSDAHKKKISTGRKKFLDANPDKIPYLLNHSSRKSWPEKFFEQMLKDAGITGWVYNYSHGRYRYDYAFPELRVDIEIDGSTHNLDNVKSIDAERDEFSRTAGWRVYGLMLNYFIMKNIVNNFYKTSLSF